MLRADYCIVLHRDLQKELHLKKEGKVCIVLGKWEVSASKILCLHIWKLFTRDENNPIFHCKQSIDLQYLLWEAGTRVPTPKTSKISHLLKYGSLETENHDCSCACNSAVFCSSNPREHLMLPPLETQRSKMFLSEEPLEAINPSEGTRTHRAHLNSIRQLMKDIL